MFFLPIVIGAVLGGLLFTFVFIAFQEKWKDLFGANRDLRRCRNTVFLWPIDRAWI